MVGAESSVSGGAVRAPQCFNGKAATRAHGVRLGPVCTHIKSIRTLARGSRCTCVRELVFSGNSSARSQIRTHARARAHTVSHTDCCAHAHRTQNPTHGARANTEHTHTHTHKHVMRAHTHTHTQADNFLAMAMLMEIPDQYKAASRLPHRALCMPADSNGLHQAHPRRRACRLLRPSPPRVRRSRRHVQLRALERVSRGRQGFSGAALSELRDVQEGVSFIHPFARKAEGRARV